MKRENRSLRVDEGTWNLFCFASRSIKNLSLSNFFYKMVNSSNFVEIVNSLRKSEGLSEINLQDIKKYSGVDFEKEKE